MATVQILGGGVPSSASLGVVNALKALLPETYHLVPDLQFRDVHGRPWQVDLVVLAPHAAFVVELCHWTGTVSGDEFQWSVDGRERWAPQALTGHKTRVLREHLVGRDRRLAPLQFEPLTVLTQTPASLDIAANGRPGITGPKGLAKAVSDPSLVANHARDGLAAEQVLLALNRCGYTSTEPLEFGSYRVVDHLESSRFHDLFRVISTSPDSPGMRLLRADRGGDVARLRSRHEELAEVSLLAGFAEVLDLFEDDFLGACLVYVEPEGRTLRGLLHRGVDAAESVALGWFRDIAEALAQAHNRGVVHGRVAPEHLVVCPDARARLTSPAPLFDWAPAVVARGEGAAASSDALAASRRFDAPHASDTFIDPLFVAPELRARQTAPPKKNGAAAPGDPRVDVFGLAATLHYLYASDAMSLQAHRYVAPENCPEQLSDLLASMLEPEAASRVTSVEPLLDVLDELIASKRVAIELSGVPQVEANEIIGDRFEVQRRLGIGPAWATFALHDGMTGRVKVGKVFDPAIKASGLERVARRTPEHSVLQRPEVLLDAKNRSWMIVDFVDGSPLSGLTDSGERLVAGEAIAVLDALLQVYSEMHPDARHIAELEAWGASGLLRAEERSQLRQLRSEGFVHGDVKPSSIIRVHGGVALVDPLLRFEHEDLPRPQHRYTDPDPDSGRTRWDVAPDLFAAGVLLYEMICGAYPFASGLPSVGEEPIDPAVHLPDIGYGLADVLRRACSPRRVERFVDAAEMRREVLSSSQIVIDRDVLAQNNLYRGFWRSVHERSELHTCHWFANGDIPEEWAVRFRTFSSGIAVGARVLRQTVEGILEFPVDQTEHFALLRDRSDELESRFGRAVTFDDDFRQVLVAIEGQIGDVERRESLARAVADQTIRLMAAASDMAGFSITEDPTSENSGTQDVDTMGDDTSSRRVSNRWVLDTTDSDDERSSISRVSRHAAGKSFDESARNGEEQAPYGIETSPSAAVPSGSSGSGSTGSGHSQQPHVIDLTESGVAKIEAAWLPTLSESRQALVESLMATTRMLGGATANDGQGNLVLAWAVRNRPQPLPLVAIGAAGINIRTDLLSTLPPFDGRRALRTLRHRLASYVEADWMGLSEPVVASLGWPDATTNAAADLNQTLDWIVQQLDTQASDDIMSVTWVSEVLVRPLADVLNEAARLGVLVDDIPLMTRRSAFVVAAELGVVADELS